MGLLAVYVFGTEREFADDELTLLRAMADHSAQAIANARLFEEVRLKSSHSRLSRHSWRMRRKPSAGHRA